MLDRSTRTSESAAPPVGAPGRTLHGHCLRAGALQATSAFPGIDDHLVESSLGRPFYRNTHAPNRDGDHLAPSFVPNFRMDIRVPIAGSEVGLPCRASSL